MEKVPREESRFAWIEIDLSRIEHNLGIIRSYTAGPETRIMAVVKADAYGHGAVQVSKRALKCGAYALGVALAEEGLLLREEGIDAPIYVLGECPPAAAAAAIEEGLILSVNSIESARTYAAISRKKNRRASININIDTGMHRLGIDWKDTQDLSVIRSLSSLYIEGVFSHFSCAGQEDPAFTRLQMERFAAAISTLENSGFNCSNIHFANSAAFFRHDDAHYDMVRTGISMYGLTPYQQGWEDWLPEKVKKAINDLRPVLSLKSRISFIKKLGRDEPVSYGGTFRTVRDSVIATVPVGYADGFPRMLSNRTKVLLQGMEAPVVGSITMDQFMIDVTDISGQKDISPGDEVVLIGESGDKKITADDLAETLGTINYEITCMLKDRVPRVYKK